MVPTKESADLGSRAMAIGFTPLMMAESAVGTLPVFFVLFLLSADMPKKLAIYSGTLSGIICATVCLASWNIIFGISFPTHAFLGFLSALLAILLFQTVKDFRSASE